MLEIKDISDAITTFGDDGSITPRWEDIPEEFKNYHHPLSELAESLFFEGGKLDYKAKPGVDKTKAVRMLISVLRSFNTEHERKMAGAAYMLSEFFEIE